ncbi:MAG TPA: adenylate cyclase regulatory domain-containing protein [Actinomycetota bacterium]|nr:adenylate cyclase regulatory domain-containing protein [Actinomycetota bacterium]
MWERASLSIPSILAAVEAGRVSLDFLDAPAWVLPEPLPITYREFAEEQGIPFELLQGIQVAMGFAAPDPDDRVARDDARLAELARIVIADEAEAGEVLTSQETTEETEDASVRFERSRTAHLKGVATPTTLYRAFRGS